MIYCIIYIGSLCIDFSIYSDQYVGVEHDICCDRGGKKKKKKETIIILSSLQACFVIAHSSGDFMVRIFVPLFTYFKNLLKNNTSIDNYLFPLFPCMHTDQTKWLINTRQGSHEENPRGLIGQY